MSLIDSSQNSDPIHNSPDPQSRVMPTLTLYTISAQTYMDMMIDIAGRPTAWVPKPPGVREEWLGRVVRLRDVIAIRAVDWLRQRDVICRLKAVGASQEPMTITLAEAQNLVPEVLIYLDLIVCY